MPTKTFAALRRYRAKRNFKVTPEPAGGGKSSARALQFVVQKHWASRLHYDFRLELGGAMKSWAIPKGPSFDPKDKRMAVHGEDHPLAYNTFEGEIPEKQYGAGKVIVWDKGTWHPVDDPKAGYRAGKLKFELQGRKLKGRWNLVRIRSRQGKQDAWLLIKDRDSHARPATEFSVAAVRGQERPAQPRRPDFHRLPAQQLRRDHSVRVVGAGPPGPGDFGAGQLE